jgi:hypothetical protein
MKTILNDFFAWFSAPFDVDNMTPIQWFLLVGIVIISAILWRHFILRHIISEV